MNADTIANWTTAVALSGALFFVLWVIDEWKKLKAEEEKRDDDRARTDS